MPRETLIKNVISTQRKYCRVNITARFYIAEIYLRPKLLRIVIFSGVCTGYASLKITTDTRRNFGRNSGIFQRYYAILRSFLPQHFLRVHTV